MAINMGRTFKIQEPIEKVWQFLSDPSITAICVPGAQITEQLDGHTYKGCINVKIGPTSTNYKGEIRVVGIDERNYEIEIAGKGQDTRGKGSASLVMKGRLRALSDGSTEVAGTAEITVVGLLAQMGSRVFSDIANFMFAEFTRNFQRQVRQYQSPSKARAIPA
ncbi:MAG TPA: SRPBCC family protein [Candidatus Angelobacter sp.]|nr:SRPBCC family protein [Candidatus Angelobacter sp.]